MKSPGHRFREAIVQEQPLQVVGVINAYAALLAAQSGFNALYLSGGGVAAASCGVPDLGIITLEDVLIDVYRITAVTDQPLLVDIDTGWGGLFNIARTIQRVEKAGAAAVHIEDQVQQKRCGHRPNKAIISQQDMVDRIKAAVDVRRDNHFVIMARTDALAVEGLEAAIERAVAYCDAGADMLFPEAITDLAMYRRFADAVKVPILANITEFGATPLYTTEQLAANGVGLVLYPLSAFRAMSKAALEVYGTIRREGSQQKALPLMQSRQELYHHLGYHRYEAKLDALLSS